MYKRRLICLIGIEKDSNKVSAASKSGVVPSSLGKLAVLNTDFSDARHCLCRRNRYGTFVCVLVGALERNFAATEMRRDNLSTLQTLESAGYAFFD